MGGLVHLATRFFGALSPRPLARADEIWVRQQLTTAELALWDRMSRPDRKHAAGVGRAVVDRLGARATRPVLVAALLHDVGKVDSGLGTMSRALATVVTAVLGRRRVTGWATSGGPRGRLARYIEHDRIGAELLAGAGADPLAVAWARDHHLPASGWTIDPAIAAVLKEVDDD